ncbi:hypothetical protein K474DRAFT_1702584 [Panus rudis PR-1116 ss-1]|nr:hypothetical protein K474DRAFT_1702584 [Panus rudis PR-1116 ss-1]
MLLLLWHVSLPRGCSLFPGKRLPHPACFPLVGFHQGQHWSLGLTRAVVKAYVRLPLLYIALAKHLTMPVKHTGLWWGITLPFQAAPIQEGLVLFLTLAQSWGKGYSQFSS